MPPWALEWVIPNGDSAHEGLALNLHDPDTQSFWCLLFISQGDWLMGIFERLKIKLKKKPPCYFIINKWLCKECPEEWPMYSTPTVYQHEQQVSVEYLARREQFLIKYHAHRPQGSHHESCLKHRPQIELSLCGHSSCVSLLQELMLSFSKWQSRQSLPSVILFSGIKKKQSFLNLAWETFFCLLIWDVYLCVYTCCVCWVQVRG